MCGIAGIIAFGKSQLPDRPAVLAAMASALQHRGPDESGLYKDEHAALVHARLSIIDLTSGSQPMSTADGQWWISFNGEIFNYIELRDELKTRGYTFKTSSDTEVAATAFEAWGIDAFSRFNGQWALALWHPSTRTLVFSRDRVGVRPLYLCRKHDLLRFGSEVKAIFADPEVPREIDPAGLDQVFTYWSTIAPVTPFAGVEQLKPGTARVYDAAGKIFEFQFWRPSFSYIRPFDSLDEAAAALREKLERATRLRMVRADVPVGSYLSGGLDSSVVARLGVTSCAGVFNTYSIRFDDPEFDETQYQRAMASTLESHHEELVVSATDIARAFPDVVFHTESPLLRTAPVPLFLLSGAVRNAGVKAVLTGEGADEFLGGYDLFKEAKVREFWSKDLSSKVRPLLFDRLYPYLARSPQQARGMALEFWRQGIESPVSTSFTHGPRWNSTSKLKRFFSRPLLERIVAKTHPSPQDDLPADFARWDVLARAQYLEITTLLSGYLLSSQGDRMLMAHSVEGRFPYLDIDVMEFGNSLAPSYKMAGLNEKAVLRRMAKDLVPPAVLQRKKQPYRAPDAACFFGPHAPAYVEELFDEETLKHSGLFDPLAVRMLVNKCSAAAVNGRQPLSNSDNMAVVGILSTLLLQRQFTKDLQPLPLTPRADTTRSGGPPLHLIERIPRHSHPLPLNS